MFTISLCKDKGGYSVKPKKQTKLNLKKLKQKYKTILDANIIIVIQKEGYEIVIHDYGELLFKNCKDEEKIREIANEIYKSS